MRRLFNVGLSLNTRIDLYKLLELFRYGFILIDGFPRTCWLTCRTVDAFGRVDQKLVWEYPPVQRRMQFTGETSPHKLCPSYLCIID